MLIYSLSFWLVLVALGMALGCPWLDFGAHLALFGLPLGFLGSLWGPLGVPWGSLGGPLGVPSGPWGSLGVFWGFLRGPLVARGRRCIVIYIQNVWCVHHSHVLERFRSIIELIAERGARIREMIFRFPGGALGRPRVVTMRFVEARRSVVSLFIIKHKSLRRWRW